MATPTREWPHFGFSESRLPTLIELGERVGAALGLALLTPVMFGIGCVVAVISRQSPLVGHRRMGWRGRTLWVLKFRTMWDTPGPMGLVAWLDSTWVPDEKAASDSRVQHAFARWMRRYSIDELPQLIHVAMGQMALVGPRPITREEMDLHYGPAASAVLSVRPGITGLWQVRGRNRLSYRQRRRLDLFFVRKASLPLYLSILRWTVRAVFYGDHAY